MENEYLCFYTIYYKGSRIDHDKSFINANSGELAYKILIDDLLQDDDSIHHIQLTGITKL